MKRRLLKAGFCLGAVLLTGAVAVTTVDKLVIEPKIISSWSDLYRLYREQPGLPPLPDFEPETVYKMIQAGDWSFTTNRNWFQLESGGTLYVSKKSAALQHLKLPLTVRIYNYLPTGETYILSSQDGEKFKSEASFTSEPLTGEEFEEMTASGQRSSLLFGIWEKRIVFEVTLKPEADAWGDLFAVRQTSLSAGDAQAGLSAPQMMMMSVPEGQSSNIWLYLNAHNQMISLNVFSPEGFTNRVELYTCADLVSGVWSVARQDLYPSGTNPAVWDVTSDISNRFFRAGNMDIDSDGDGLPDAREQIVYRSSPALTDTDGDGLDDGAEVQTYGTNPAGNDTDNDGMPDGWEIEHGLNPLVNDGLDDPDGDLFSNQHEYLINTDPMSNLSAVETVIFDEDTANLQSLSDVSVITNAGLSSQGELCLCFSMPDDDHYTPRVDFEDAVFGNNDTLEFYIRNLSGLYTNTMNLRVYYSSSTEMSVPVDVRSYLYDSNGVPSDGIAEEYKKVSIPWEILLQSGSNQVGTIRHMKLEIPSGATPQDFYVDRISLQDKSGMTSENLNVLSEHHLEITGGDQLDPISLRNTANHTMIRQSDGSSIPVSRIGLRSWVTGFNGNASSPVVKHYIYAELSEPLIFGETYMYSNRVQDISGNYPDSSAVTFTVTSRMVSSSIKVNQVGWLPEATKTAYVGNYLGDLGAMPVIPAEVSVRRADDGSAVYTAQMVRAVESDLMSIGEFLIPFSGEEAWRVDITLLQTPGTYYLDIPGIGCSYEFEIGSNIYADTYYHCMRSLWYQRSGICMTNPAYSGIWTRQGDAQLSSNIAFYHNSVYDKSPMLYAGEEIGGYADFTGGWYDAADYNKYTKSAADAVNLLLTMYEIRPGRFADNQLNLPESGNGIPDILDEAKWELDWIAKMVSSNGAAFNKVSRESWVQGMPDEQNGKMWVTLKTTRDTAAACAVLAKAARIYAPYDPAVAALYSNKAALAWQCLTNFPDSYPIPAENESEDDYANPPGTNWVVNGITNIIPGIGTGPYFGTNDVIYRLWAAVEMYRLTENTAVHDEFSNIVYRAKGEVSATNFLADIMSENKWMGNARNIVPMYDYITLTNLPVNGEWQDAVKDAFLEVIHDWHSGYDMELPYDFEIKSHSILNLGEGSQIRRPYGYILAYELTGDSFFLERARVNIDWPLGANPLSTTYITGIGSRHPLHPHNKIDHYDGVDEPIPGYNIYGLAENMSYKNYYRPIIDYSYPFYRRDNGPDAPYYPAARKYVDVWESVEHGEFVIDDLARTAMVFAYFSSTNAP